MQEDIDKKRVEAEEKEKQLWLVKNEIVKVGFEKTAKEAGKGALEGISALVGSSKAKRLEAKMES